MGGIAKQKFSVLTFVFSHAGDFVRINLDYDLQQQFIEGNVFTSMIRKSLLSKYGVVRLKGSFELRLEVLREPDFVLEEFGIHIACDIPRSGRLTGPCQTALYCLLHDLQGH